MKNFTIEGIIGLDVTAKFIRTFLENESENDELEITMSSPGGLVHEGVDMFNLFRDYSEKNNKVNFKVSSLAASISSYIILSGNEISIEPNSSVVIHNVWDLTIGDYREMQKNAIILEKLTNMIAREYSRRSKKTITEIRQLMDEETFFVGNEIIKNGFADKILHSDSKNMIPKDELLVLNQGRIANCLNAIRKSGRAENDIQKAVALIGNYNLSSNNIIEPKENIIIPENKQEVNNNMTKAELKEKYPDLYNEIYNDGVVSANKELKSIKAFMKFKDIAPDVVLNAIAEGKTYDEEFQAEIQASALKKTLQNDRIKDNPKDDLKTPENDATETPEETEAAIKKFNAMYGRKK